MKINKWTLGLAALGLVSLVTEAGAQTNALLTTVSATTISGYVDTSAVWNPGSGNANPAPYAFNAGKQDGFNVDSIDIRLQKALEEGQWSAGYVAELMFGPDADAITGGSPIRQAYVEMRVPIGNGLDFQMGRWDNLIGYESSDSYKNPNWTRSYGYSLEPTEHTGLLATYKFSDMITAQVGVADTLTTTAINGRSTGVLAPNGEPEGKKALVSLLSITAPDSWGFAKGSSFYAGLDWGQGPSTFNPPVGANPYATRDDDGRVHIYLGGTLNTPIKDLTVGGAWDYITHQDVTVAGVGSGIDAGHAYALAGYGSYKLTDKLTLNGRAEYAEGNVLGLSTAAAPSGPLAGLPSDPSFHEVFALTGTLQYDLWANVISRLELRWDHACDGGSPFGGTVSGVGAKKNEVLLAANVIYKF
jgi:hypothetical protein